MTVEVKKMTREYAMAVENRLEIKVKIMLVVGESR